MLIVLPASRESGFSGSGSTINARGNLNSPTGNISDRPTNLAVSVGFHAGAGVVGGKEVPLPQKQDHRTVGPINPLTVPVGLNEGAGVRRSGHGPAHRVRWAQWATTTGGPGSARRAEPGNSLSR